MGYLLQHLLQSSADRHPSRTAVVDGERVATYGELEARSNQLGHLLIRLGVGRHDRVGLYMDKSLEAVIGIYGVLKSGAAYVPLDPQSPALRLGYIARNCDLQVLLTGAEKASSWKTLLEVAPNVRSLILLNSAVGPAPDAPAGVRFLPLESMSGEPERIPPVDPIDDDLAYILYTSGSTGDPKGVMLSHRNALTFVEWAADAFRIQPEDRLSNHAPFHFDLSVFDLFAAAASGAAVALVPPRASLFPIEISRFIDSNEITVWYSVPSVLSMLVQRGNLKPGAFPQLRSILFAGEVFPTKYLAALMETLPHVSFANLYGPTETNVCTYYEVRAVPDVRSEPVPIGKAIANVDVFAVSDDGRLALPGEIGELWVRGSSVMRGYWGDPEQTARGLVAAPGEGLGAAYRTGDRVRQDPDGNYRLLGRRDAQIKSRGYRIELGEIEGALYGHPGVVECAVAALPDELITNRLKAYVVVGGSVTEADLHRFCAERLPRYMIPEAFEFRETLPKTSTGKVDRQALVRQPAVA